MAGLTLYKDSIQFGPVDRSGAEKVAKVITSTDMYNNAFGMPCGAENRAVDGKDGRGAVANSNISEAAKYANIGAHSTGTNPTNTVTFAADTATKAATQDVKGL